MASPDHRVPALAARAEAFARDGDQDQAVGTLEEAFSYLASREGGAGEDNGFKALVAAATVIDPGRCRRHRIQRLAAHQRTPACLAAAVLADPELAPVTVSLLRGDDLQATYGLGTGGLSQ
ncbi:hypothetical protein OG898_28665 [Streptomyces sp. NBC_00193]|uniref:hypothetical protein n=1 Tax=unclassified Streptomyces TaxID=2593676 RepID=UPI002252315C|nr:MULTISPECIES: hypothetical protein [unclassified Streptomyces]MCX5129923.1 hypothetical protein [Streptomyces sp. NBC_00347]MCX5300397.1 hypothetical protein [Streptomyces sp. NBC_00193]